MVFSFFPRPLIPDIIELVCFTHPPCLTLDIPPSPRKKILIRGRFRKSVLSNAPLMPTNIPRGRLIGVHLINQRVYDKIRTPNLEMFRSFQTLCLLNADDLYVFTTWRARVFHEEPLCWTHTIIQSYCAVSRNIGPFTYAWCHTRFYNVCQTLMGHIV